MTAPHPPILFGTELRQRRMHAGLSLTELARLVHYSKSHLSKVETGRKPPSHDLARRCDAALDCEGALARLAGPATAGVSGTRPHDPGEVWMLSLSPDGDDRFGTVSRRDLLAGGLAAGGLVGLGGWAGATAPATGQAGGLAAFRNIFDQLRQLGQQLGAPVLLPMLVTQTHALRRIAADASAGQRAGALRLAARFAEYAGWMAQEAGDDQRALWWTDHAVAMATGGGDEDLAGYAYVRRALITLYRQDAAQTVALARRAAAASTNPRVLGLAAQREAQGHALAGDVAACRRCLDLAADLLAQGNSGQGPTIGSSHVADPVALAHGWCQYDLGQPAAAARTLQTELDRIPATAVRARTRWGARLALAYAASGELDQACVAVAPVLDAHEQLGSATIRSDLGNLARTMNRWPGYHPARPTRLRLTAALSLPQGAL